MIKHRAHKPAGILRSRILYERQRDEHQCLGKDDRHHVGCEQLQGDILAGAAHLLVAYDALRILYRNLADTLYQNNSCTYNCIENDDLDEEHHQSTTRDGGET